MKCGRDVWDGLIYTKNYMAHMPFTLRALADVLLGSDSEVREGGPTLPMGDLPNTKKLRTASDMNSNSKVPGTNVLHCGFQINERKPGLFC